MSTHALIFDVCVALLAGAKFDTGTLVCGAAPRGFVCYDLRLRRALRSPESFDVVTSLGAQHEDRRGSGAMFETQKGEDWTPYGAARAFVQHAEDGEVEAALAAWKGARR